MSDSNTASSGLGEPVLIAIRGSGAIRGEEALMADSERLRLNSVIYGQGPKGETQAWKIMAMNWWWEAGKVLRRIEITPSTEAVDRQF